MRLDRRAFGRLVGVVAAGTAAAGTANGQQQGGGPGNGGRRRGPDGDGTDGGRRRGGAGGAIRAETLVSIPGDLTPENLAVGPEGDLYFGITAGEVRRVDRETALTATDLTLDDTDLVATLPAAAGVQSTLGGTLYVAVNAPDTNGVWTIPPGGDEAVEYVSIPRDGGFVNDIAFDRVDDRLLVTESFDGVVYEVPVGPGGAALDGVEATEWAAPDSLDTPEFGANGVVRRDDDVVVAVTRAVDDEGADVGRLVSIPVDDDGGAGDPEVLIESPAVFGADGIAVGLGVGADGDDGRPGPGPGPGASADGAIHVAANARNEVVVVPPVGDPVVVADAGDGLVFPSDVAFGGGSPGAPGGPGGPGGGPLFVCNFAVTSPEAAGILRLGP
ncbi:hypothetical protein [Halobaculum marinum]|uniref:Uncharacterized protein n=1 Tax=Halobaculum marinum TaxID=3031996 RepID=A0ABD5X0D7_9EURY|nr:hypothetical protein [Halobaculum sp. DT55]